MNMNRNITVALIVMMIILPIGCIIAPRVNGIDVERAKSFGCNSDNTAIECAEIAENYCRSVPTDDEKCHMIADWESIRIFGSVLIGSGYVLPPQAAALVTSLVTAQKEIKEKNLQEEYTNDNYKPNY